MEPSIAFKEPRPCPSCGTPVPSGAPQELCPKCLLAAASVRTETGEGVAITPSGLPSAPSMERIAAAFPQLEILGLIGSGGMGAVFKARQRHLDRIVALKVLSEDFAARPAFVERFEREARFLARLNHPNIVTLYDFGQSGGFCFLLMEYVDGVNLGQAMRAGRFTPAQALSVVPKICEALQYAHEQGILHRDIKPANLLLDDRGRVKIADFGVAKLLGGPGTDMTLTASGAAVGTPAYMAPEQIEKPSDVDHRADIYSLGVVFYEMLTGELPLGHFPAPSEKSAMDHRIDAIVMKALKKERELRQQSADEVRTQVQGVAETPLRSRPTPAVTSRGGGSRAWSVFLWCLGLFGMVVVAVGILVPTVGYFWLSTRVSTDPNPRPAPVVGSSSAMEPSVVQAPVSRPVSNPPPSGAERERLLVNLGLAEQKLAEDKKQHEVGRIASIDLASSQRDVDVARCLLVGDVLGAASARLRYAEMKLAWVTQRVKNGKGTTLERSQAEAEVQLLRIDWQEAAKKTGGRVGKATPAQ